MVELEPLHLITPELAERLGIPAAKGAAAGGMLWLAVLVIAAFVLGLVGLVLVRRRLRARGERGLGLMAFVVIVPLALGTAAAAWVGFTFGAARDASHAIEEALTTVGEGELGSVLVHAERLAVDAGVPLEALDADLVAEVVSPYLARLAERERALADASLAERLPPMIERAALEAALQWAKAELGARFSWRALSERASALAVERLRDASHALLAPVRHAGVPLLAGWAALILVAHGLALRRAGNARPTDS